MLCETCDSELQGSFVNRDEQPDGICIVCGEFIQPGFLYCIDCGEDNNCCEWCGVSLTGEVPQSGDSDTSRNLAFDTEV